MTFSQDDRVEILLTDNIGNYWSRGRIAKVIPNDPPEPRLYVFQGWDRFGFPIEISFSQASMIQVKKIYSLQST